MSRYTVGVILPKELSKEDIVNNIKKTLEPFDANLRVEPYIAYTKDELVKKYDEYKTSYENAENNPQVHEILKLVKGDDLIFPDLGIESFEDFSENYTDSGIDDNGNALSSINPNAKWNYYEIGGRHSETVETYNGEFCNYAKIKDIKFKQEFSDKEIENMQNIYNIMITEGDFYTPEYYKKRYPNFEDFLNDRNFSTYAILDYNGEWFEPGKMKAFGISDASPEEILSFKKSYIDKIKSYDKEDWLVLVECHIS